MDEVEHARRNLEEAHQLLRSAIKNAAVAAHVHTAAMRAEEDDEDEARWSLEKADFMRRAVMVDYVVGIYFSDMGEVDYHAVLDTDGKCPRHRSYGLSSLTTNFLLTNGTG